MKTLIISDIHANMPALEAVLTKEQNFDFCIFLGDVVDYGPNPKECIEFLRNQKLEGVIGNHDNALVLDVDCGCRGDFKKFSEETRKWHKTLVSEKELLFLHSLPQTKLIEIDGRSIYMAHASPDGNLFRYLSEDEMDIEIQNNTAEIILVGHTHVQYKRQVGNTLIVNPGSVGLARDGVGACYAILENNIIHLHRIPYDVTQTISALQKSPISEASKIGLIKILQGTWKG